MLLRSHLHSERYIRLSGGPEIKKSESFHILILVILVNNQLDAQFFPYIFISKLYMFRATMFSSSGETVVSIRHLVYVGDRLVPDGQLHRVTYTRCPIDTIDSHDDEHMVARNMYSVEINIYRKNCASSWLFTRIVSRCTANKT